MTFRRYSSTNVAASTTFVLFIIIFFFFMHTNDSSWHASSVINKLEDRTQFHYAHMKKQRQKNLKRIENIRRQNSDPLPTTSYFTIQHNFLTFTYNESNTDTNQLCMGSAASTCWPKFAAVHSAWFSVPAKKLLTCNIAKNMSTMMRAIMCYLYNPTKFVNAGRQLHTEFPSKSFCIKEVGYEYGTISGTVDGFMYSNTNETNSIRLMDEWHPFTVIREPIDRFLSAYIDMCISNRNYCNGCFQNMTCLIVSQYERMMIHTGLETNEDQHFAPQNWKCDFARFLDKFELIRYKDDVTEHLHEVLTRRDVIESNVDFILRELRTHRTFHSTVGSPAREFLERRLRGSPFLMELVVKMYYWDFILFNYTIPEIRFRN